MRTPRGKVESVANRLSKPSRSGSNRSVSRICMSAGLVRHNTNSRASHNSKNADNDADESAPDHGRESCTQGTHRRIRRQKRPRSRTVGA